MEREEACITMSTCQYLEDTTQDMLARAEKLLDPSLDADDSFAARQKLAQHLGAHLHSDYSEFGFWIPDVAADIAAGNVAAEDVYLELLTPLEPITAFSAPQRLTFRRERLPMQLQGEFAWLAIAGLHAGCRDSFGCFYQLRYRDSQGQWHSIFDPLAYSLPFGAFAPAELYDIDRMDHERQDRDYFRRITASEAGARLGKPCNILQLHVPTATVVGTLAGLSGLYGEIARKIRDSEALTPTEQNYVGYDAVQLMPVEPVIEYEGSKTFWQQEQGDHETHEVVVRLHKPDMHNWGYDVLIAGSSAINPVLLESGRPDELADFAALLHNFPGKPMQLIFDVVYGHADNQGLALLNSRYFSGPNMYGQDLNYKHPMVRAILLEMQRRKVNFGADGVRIDGAQDFKVWDPERQVLEYDDAYLESMSAVLQRVADVDYYPWMIFEDGRPWPREDWETASTYRAVIDKQPHCFQWGPLTFAHNTPCLQGFWSSKWWRIEEIVRIGSHWINGCANHDTLRRGYQISPEQAINPRQGNNLFEILRRSYDHPAASLLTYGFFPGVPMEFIHATMHAPWAFIRNTDLRYSVKVVAEEAGFFDWQVDSHHYQQEGVFARLKELGFADVQQVRNFMKALQQAVSQNPDDDPDSLEATISSLASTLESEELHAPVALDIGSLRHFARVLMEDLHHYCNAMRFAQELNPAQTAFNLQLRNFRRQHSWLSQNLQDNESLERQVDEAGNTLFYGLRVSPDGTEQVLFVANMEGDSIHVTPTQLPIEKLEPEDWQLAVASPGVHFHGADQSVELHDAEGILLYRELF